MKYQKSAFPYLMLLILLLTTLPFINYKTEKMQEIVIELKTEAKEYSKAIAKKDKEKDGREILLYATNP